MNRSNNYNRIPVQEIATTKGLAMAVTFKRLPRYARKDENIKNNEDRSRVFYGK